SLSCPLFQGDSLHETSAKAASVRSEDGGRARYQRMWMGKMTRTGLLFPEESRPAYESVPGVGGSASSSWRGSASSVSSVESSGAGSRAGSVASSIGKFFGGGLGKGRFVNKPVSATPKEDRGKATALMVLTHPELAPWHKTSIREAVGEYGIGVIFVPLFRENTAPDDEDANEEELPVLRPLDPSTMSGFTSFNALMRAASGAKKLKYGKGKEANLEEEMVLEVNVGGSGEEIVKEVVRGVKDIMAA
ncbi:hypothetical protein LSUE1_G010372, partial [Lachnellula suecica]